MTLTRATCWLPSHGLRLLCSVLWQLPLIEGSPNFDALKDLAVHLGHELKDPVGGGVLGPEV